MQIRKLSKQQYVLKTYLALAKCLMLCFVGFSYISVPTELLVLTDNPMKYFCNLEAKENLVYDELL